MKICFFRGAGCGTGDGLVFGADCGTCYDIGIKLTTVKWISLISVLTNSQLPMEKVYGNFKTPYSFFICCSSSAAHPSPKFTVAFASVFNFAEKIKHISLLASAAELSPSDPTNVYRQQFNCPSTKLFSVATKALSFYSMGYGLRFSFIASFSHTPVCVPKNAPWPTKWNNKVQPAFPFSSFLRSPAFLSATSSK